VILTTTTNRTITRTITSTSTTTTTDPCETATCAQQAFAPPESGRGKHIRNVRGPPLSTFNNEKNKRAGACCILVVVVVVVSVCWDGRISRKPRFPHQTVSDLVVPFPTETPFPARRQIR